MPVVWAHARVLDSEHALLGLGCAFSRACCPLPLLLNTKNRLSWPESDLTLYVMAHTRYYLTCQHHAGSSRQEGIMLKACIYKLTSARHLPKNVQNYKVKDQV